MNERLGQLETVTQPQVFGPLSEGESMLSSQKNVDISAMVNETTTHIMTAASTVPESQCAMFFREVLGGVVMQLETLRGLEAMDGDDDEEFEDTDSADVDETDDHMFTADDFEDDVDLEEDMMCDDEEPAPEEEDMMYDDEELDLDEEDMLCDDEEPDPEEESGWDI